MQPTSVLLTATGRDRPGVTAAFFAALASFDVEVRDVEQVVIRDRLVLAVLVDLHGEYPALRASLIQTAEALQMDCELCTGPRAAAREIANRCYVTLLGRPLRPGAISDIAGRVTEAGGNVESMAQLATYPVTCVEMTVGAVDPVRLRAPLVQAAKDTGVDIAVERAGLLRRAKRLVVLDVDSTLIREEGIDVLAQRAGVGEQVAQVTRRAMAGELDFAQSLRERVALLAGLPASEVDSARESLRLTPGARTFVRTLRRLGYHVGVVSGGFTVFTDRFVDELDLDFAAANTLEVVDGALTGRVVGPIVDRAGKADALRRFAAQYRVPLEQTIAVGDGANDIDMLEAAGLGIAFNAKTALRAAADAAVNLPYLDTILFMLGLTRDEVTEAAG